MRKKKKKEEGESPGQDSDPGPLPYQGPDRRIIIIIIKYVIYNEVTGSKVLPLPPSSSSSSPPVQEEGTNVLGSKPTKAPLLSSLTG
jgi:hypothetical protein